MQLFSQKVSICLKGLFDLKGRYFDTKSDDKKMDQCFCTLTKLIYIFHELWAEKKYTNEFMPAKRSSII